MAAGGLRSFFRWLQFRGRIGPELIAAVPLFPRWRLAALPPVLTDDQLTGLLARFDRSTPVGRRDHAIAVCLIDLGLRVGEVANLTLDDVDAAAGIIQLVAGKPRRARILPMPERVRRVVLDYIRRDRPGTTARHLFVRHRLPLGAPVTRELVRGVIRRAYAVVPGCERLTGTHILRHTAASRLLRAGADLKRIADILGHRSIDTTAIYAKVDVDRLAAVALPWPVAGEVHP
jgi:site-specific recombinase XerD